MPPIVAGVGLTVAAGVIAQATITTILINVAISVSLGLLAQALSPKPRSGDSNKREQGRKVLIRSTISPHQVIYGRDLVAGSLEFAESTGTGNKFLHLVISYAGHGIDAFETLLVNDNSIDVATQINAAGMVTSGQFANKLRAKFYVGTTTQAADSDLISETNGKWTTAHQGKEITYGYYRLEFDSDVYPTGVPQLRVEVRGKKLWDPRSNPGDPSIKTWSDNASLVPLDFIMAEYGFNTPVAEIHETSWIAAANTSDEIVDGITRYTANGSFLIDGNAINDLENLLTASLGSIVFQQSSFRGYAASATAISTSITESDLRGNISVTTRPSRDSLFNAVAGTYIDDTKFYSPTNFPKVTNSLYETEDNSEQLLQDIELLYTVNPRRGQRLARLSLDSHRQGLTASIPLKLTKFSIAAWDTVDITIADLGWSAKKFRVLSWGLAIEGINIIVQEESDAIYTFDPNDIITYDLAPDTLLPNAFTIAPPTSVTLQSGTDQLLAMTDGSIISQIEVNWLPAPDAFVKNYEVEWRNDSQTLAYSFAARPQRDAQKVFLGPAQDGVFYSVRIRAVNTLNVKSVWVEIISHTVIGKTQLPPDVPNLVHEELNEGTRRFTWTYPNKPVDFAGFLVRANNSASQTWETAQPLHQIPITTPPFETKAIRSGLWTVLIKAVDTTGNESLTPAFVAINLGDEIADNIIATTNHRTLTWPGTKVNCTVDGNNDLVADLVSVNPMWAVGAINQWSSDDTLPMWIIDSKLAFSGDGVLMYVNDNELFYQSTYKEMEYNTTVIPQKNRSELLLQIVSEGGAKVEYLRPYPNSMFLQDSALMWASDAALMWTVNNLYVPWTGQVITDRELYNIKVIIEAGPNQGKLTTFNVIVDMPDVVERIEDAAVVSGGTRLTLLKNFDTIKNIALTLEDDGGTAVTAKWLDKNPTLGPLVRCFNSSGTGVAGTVDVTVQGY